MNYAGVRVGWVGCKRNPTNEIVECWVYQPNLRPALLTGYLKNESQVACSFLGCRARTEHARDFGIMGNLE